MGKSEGPSAADGAKAIIVIKVAATAAILAPLSGNQEVIFGTLGVCVALCARWMLANREK